MTLAQKLKAKADIYLRDRNDPKPHPYVRGMGEGYEGAALMAKADADARAARDARTLEMLKRLEWSGEYSEYTSDGTQGYWVCPECRRSENRDGEHESDCALAALIRDYEAILDAP